MESEAVNSGLKKQLEVKEEVLKSINEKQAKLQTDIVGLTKTVQSLNQTIKWLCGTLEQLQTTIDGVTQTVESLNQMPQLLCELPKDGSTCEITAVTVCQDLLTAAKSGDVNTTKILFKYSNDSCTDDDVFRNIPLTYAAEYGHVEVVRVLLEGGANVDRANGHWRTALHCAALNGHLDVCRLLLDWGAKVDPLDGGKYTPLNYAAGEGHLSVVKLLVERGADVSVKDIDGKTASDVALSSGKKDVAEWLDAVTRG